jgi:hypothetical protein
MGYLIKKPLELKKISTILNNADLINLHNTPVMIGNISADAIIVSIKCFCNAIISGYNNLYVIDDNSQSNVGNLNLPSLASNYTYYFGIGIADHLNQEGFNLKIPNTGLQLICQNSISTAATELTIEIYYFD